MYLLYGVIGAVVGAGMAVLNLFALSETYATIRVAGFPESFCGTIRRHGAVYMIGWMALGAAVGALMAWAFIADGV